MRPAQFERMTTVDLIAAKQVLVHQLDRELHNYHSGEAQSNNLHPSTRHCLGVGSLLDMLTDIRVLLTITDVIHSLEMRQLRP
jgi:hypothetical protein